MLPRGALVACALLVACKSASPSIATSSMPVCSTSPQPVAPPRTIEPAFSITFAPSLEPPALAVQVRAKARDGLLRWSSVSHARPSTLSVRDAKGAIATTWNDGVLALERAPQDFIAIDYVLAAQTQADVVISPAGFARIYGEPLFVPVDIAKERTHVTIDFDFDKAPLEAAASSFGAGKHLELDLAPIDLSKGAWIAGPVFGARFDAFEGKDDFAWVGYSAFDPRWVSAEIATLRTSVSQYFGDTHSPPFTMLLAIDKRSGVEPSPISIYPRWHGLFAIVDVDAPWSIGARMSVALGLVSRFIDAVGASPSAGYARFAAREILLASGTMTPVEYADEIDGEIAATLFADANPHAAEIARDALDASRIDALVRKSSGGKRSMRELLRAWIASGSHGAVEAISGDIPDDALGKCFVRTAMRFDELDLGFDEEKTRARKVLVGVHGAAKNAGLREGDALVSIRYDEERATHPARVVVSREGKDVALQYRPIGRTKTSRGYRVVPGIDPTSCVR